MANKINDNELKNVSGGCGEKKNYTGKLDCYDDSGKFVHTYHTEAKDNIDSARKEIRSYKLSIFVEFPNIRRIDWTITETNSGEEEKGSESR